MKKFSLYRENILTFNCRNEDRWVEDKSLVLENEFSLLQL